MLKLRYFFSATLLLFACSGAASSETGERAPLNSDIDYETCQVLYDGDCYPDTESACEAAGCPEACTTLRTEPAQVECRE